MTAPRPISLTVNGERLKGEALPRMLLVDFLRDVLGKTGTHVGCEHGVCGACTVLVDGRPGRSCLIFAVQMDGLNITTIEGFNRDDGYSPLQQALHEEHGLQCGFCTPAMLLTAAALLDTNPAPARWEIRDHLSGNFCRCTGYQSIVDAVSEVAGAAE